MTQKTALKRPGDVAREHSLGECSPLPYVGLSCNFDSLLAQNAAVSETVDDVARQLFGAPRRIGRSEARGRVSASLWLTSLQNPGVIEVVYTENVSRFGIQRSHRSSGNEPRWYSFHPRLDFASKARSYIARSSPATIISWASVSTRRSNIGSRHSDSGRPDES